MSFEVCTKMVQVGGAERAPRLAPWRARSGLESLAGFEETEIEELKWESGRDGERPTRSRIADGYSLVKSKVSIRNDLHSLPAGRQVRT